MTARITRTAQAEQDLIEIWVWIARESPNAADRQLDRIDDICAMLAEYPRLGLIRSDLREGMRHFVVGAYLILYREIPSGVEIVRVVHGARNLHDLFSEPSSPEDVP